MKFQEQPFVPLLFSGDINCYSMARAFYEQYQVKSIAYGKYYTGPNCNSRIVDYRVNPDIENDATFLKIVNDIAEQNNSKKIILVGCGDSYVALASKLKSKFLPNVIAPYISFDLMNNITQKYKFYELCRKFGIDYPDTFVYTRNMGEEVEHGFTYPVILKPSNSVTYWEHKFEGQKKIYKPKSEEELFNALDSIYLAGYQDEMIIQDMIPGDDTYMYVLTGFCDRNSDVKLMALGNVLMEEHTPKGLGNHSVVINDTNEELLDKVARLLKEIGYIGFFNLDIKYDQRDDKYKFFEINTRQGRSNYYVTGAGYNLAKYVVDEYVLGERLEYSVAKDQTLYTVIPLILALIFVKNNKYRKEMLKLILKGKVSNPAFYIKDMGFIRSLRFIKTHLSHFGKMNLDR